MSDTVVYNQYDNRYAMVFDDGETGYETDLCNPVGYEPFESQLNDLFVAGNVLSDYLAGMYPNGSPIYDDPGDETEDVSNYAYPDILAALDAQRANDARLAAQLAAANSSGTPTTPSATPAPATDVASGTPSSSATAS